MDNRWQYNLYNEETLGTLEAGKLADIVVLEKDIFSVEMDKIRDIKVCLTIVNRKVVYTSF
jgi:predicted amidohydrolase YtcJ